MDVQLAAHQVILSGPRVQRITEFRRLDIPLTVIFTRVAREPAHNNSCDPLPKKKG
jgi:hypothetical protein